MSGPSGIDVHSGLRIRLEYEDRVIHASCSAEAGVDPTADVEREIASLRSRLGYLEAWLGAWRIPVIEVEESPQ